MPYTGFALRDVAKSFLMADVRQSQASVPLDRTTILDRVAGIDGRGHRTLNLQVGLMYVALHRPAAVKGRVGARRVGVGGQGEGGCCRCYEEAWASGVGWDWAQPRVGTSEQASTPATTAGVHRRPQPEVQCPTISPGWGQAGVTP